jgi:hypothetical protein
MKLFYHLIIMFIIGLKTQLFFVNLAGTFSTDACSLQKELYRSVLGFKKNFTFLYYSLLQKQEENLQFSWV